MNGKTDDCVHLPLLDNVPSAIPLPLGGGALAPFADFSVGAPTNCTMAFNLVVQIAPLLGSVTCLIKVLAVVGTLAGMFAKLPMPPAPDAMQAFTTAISQCAECITNATTPEAIVPMIVALIKLLSQVIQCIGAEITQIAAIHSEIETEMEAAQGNPTLQDELQCAQENADNALKNVMQSIGNLQLLVNLVNTLGTIFGQPPIPLPALSSDVLQSSDRRNVVTRLQAHLDTVAGAIKMLQASSFETARKQPQ